MNDLQRRLHLLSLHFPSSSASTVPKLISRTTMMPRKKGRRKHILCETRKKERARGFSPKMPRVVDGDAGARDQREKVGFKLWLADIAILLSRLPTSDFLPTSRLPSARAKHKKVRRDAGRREGTKARPVGIPLSILHVDLASFRKLKQFTESIAQNTNILTVHVCTRFLLDWRSAIRVGSRGGKPRCQVADILQQWSQKLVECK